MWAALPWLLFFASPEAVAAAASTVDAADLEGAQQVMEASSADAPDPRPEPEHESPNVFLLRWTNFVTAKGREPETNLTLDDFGFRTEDLLRPRRDRLYLSTAVAAYAEVGVLDWLLLRGLFDTREIRDGSTLAPPIEGIAMNGNSAQDELGSGAVVRELSVVMGEDAFTVELGRFLSDVADGLVYRDYGSGIRLRADFDAMGLAPLSSELLITSVGERVEAIDANQLASLRVDWNLSPFEYVSFFVAGSDDDNGEISEVLRSAYAETLVGDEQRLNALFLQEDGGGRQGYVGMVAHLITRASATLEARVVLSGGKLSLRVPPTEIVFPEDVLLEGESITVDVGGLAADVEAHFALSDWIDVGGYAFLLSGDAPPTENGQRYRSFIGLAPWWTWTGLFFAGGLNTGLYPNRAAAAGINGRGVVGVGPGVELYGDDVRAEGRAIALAATADPPAAPLGGPSRFYGLELDANVEWEPLDFLSIGAELDVLLPGDFFAKRYVAYLALTRVTVTHGD